jgi:hypothetical protein
VGWRTGSADHLRALIGAIVSQRLSTKAAATIFGSSLFPDGHIRDAAAIAAERRGLASVGRWTEVGYLRDLSNDRRWPVPDGDPGAA